MVITQILGIGAQAPSENTPLGRKAERRLVVGAPPEPDWKALASAEAALLENPVLDRFEQYRMAVRQLLREGLKRRRSLRETYRSPRGRFQVMVAVAGVDQELEALRQLLLQGSPAMALMERFDAIRGLLLDVWM